MKILAFLQNQWFRDPERMRWILERRLARGGSRYDFTARTLFMGCRTGQVLKAGLGVEWCRKIVWAEASPQIGGKASSVFPADPEHIVATIRDVKPRVIVALGKVAAGVLMFDNDLRSVVVIGDNTFTAFDGVTLVTGPHPTARGINTLGFLRNVRDILDTIEANEPEALTR